MRKNRKIIIWIASILLFIGVLVCFIIFFPNVSDKVSGFLKFSNIKTAENKSEPSGTPSGNENREQINNIETKSPYADGGENTSNATASLKGFPYVSDGLVKKDAREVFYDCINLNDRLTDGTYADIRIRFADGEDFSVIKNVRLIREPGKKQDNMPADDSIYLCLTELELLFLSSAQFDCNNYKGTYIYPASCHEKPGTSSEIGNYRPSKEVLTLIDEEQLLEKNKTDEFFLARERFEERLAHSAAFGIDYSKVLADANGLLPGGLQPDADSGYWIYE